MKSTRGKPGYAVYGLLLLMGVMWGLTLSLAKIAVEQGGHPLGLGLWQVVVSSVLMLAIMSIKRQRIGMRSGIVRFGLICGLFGVAFPAYALFVSARYLPAGVMAIAFASLPMFTYLCSMGFGLERTEVRRLTGVAVGLVAIGLMVLPESALPGPRLVPWVALALVASMSMSFENFYAGAYRPVSLDSVQLAFGRQLGGVLVLAPLTLLTGSGIPIWLEWGALRWAATANGVLAGSAYAMLLHVIRVAGPVFASQAAYIITLAGVGWGIVLFNETHSAYIWATLALTLIAIALVQPRPSQTKSEDEGNPLETATRSG